MAWTSTWTRNGVGVIGDGVGLGQPADAGGRVLGLRDATGDRTDDDQRNARIFGLLFLATFVTSISAVLLFQPILDDPAGYIAGGGKDNQIYLGAFLEFLLIIANVGSAVVLYPIARRQNEALALGYV